MLIDFLFELRRHKLKVSTHEWMALMEALALGLHDSSLDGFYRLARAVCVKDLAQYDAFDQAFLAYFTTGGANNGGTEAINGLIELHRRVARGFRNKQNYRLRMLLIGGGLSL